MQVTKPSQQTLLQHAALWGLLWSAIVGVSYFWSSTTLDDQAPFLATAEARANWNKDLVFRQWATRHGGLYVKVDERTPPNPYLAHLPNRDVETTNGMQLTLMNPAYMMRQMTEEFEVTYGIKGSITGQILLNPINKPDAWELNTLRAFDNGLKELIEKSDVDGEPYLRLMRPMVMTEGCIKCHGHLGFKEGDIRGGISVSVPLTPYLESSQNSRNAMTATHIFVWLLGLTGASLILMRTFKHQRDQEVVELALRRSQKMDAVGQLTGGIAHDFNNILGIILGNLNLLEGRVQNDEVALKRVGNINKSTQRAINLTKQLLGFSSQQPAQTTDVNINQIIEGMDSLITRSITPKVEVERHLFKDLWTTAIDTGDFEDSVLNLILNARDAMPSGGKLTIETKNCTLDAAYCKQNHTAKPGDYVQLAISDSGEGMPTKQLEKIFEPFFTTKPQGKGTGLGLSMVFGFINRSGGHVNVYSELGVGTTFRIYLPRVKRSAQTNDVTTRQIEKSPRGDETILAVDDEANLLELLQSSLQTLGYKVLIANNGKQAIRILAEEPAISLLFSDVVMPGGMNGYELAEQATVNNPDLKVLLTSGYTEKAIAHNGQTRFSAHLLSKPYTQIEMAQRVREILDSSSTQ